MKHSSSHLFCTFQPLIGGLFDDVVLPQNVVSSDTILGVLTANLVKAFIKSHFLMPANYCFKK